MIVKYAKNLVFCRRAKSGEDRKEKPPYVYKWTMSQARCHFFTRVRIDDVPLKYFGRSLLAGAG